jgi:CrcB protein
MLFQTLLVGIGGFIGSILRFLTVNLVYRVMAYPDFPYGTLVVNVIGCFVIGFLSALAETREAFTPELRIFLFIGILGGFTTFSSFGYDTFGLIRDGSFFYAATNIVIQVFIGLGAVWVGYTLSRIVWG